MAKTGAYIAFDISDDRTRRRFSKLLEKYGSKIQHSVFIFELTKPQFVTLLNEVQGFYFRAASGRKHKDGKRLSIIVVPLCKLCGASVRLFGCVSQDESFILV